MNINFEIREECLPYEDLTRRPNILFLQGEKFIDCKTYHGDRKSVV